MSGRLAIVRAAHLLDYLAVMRRVGVPVDRDLAKSQLPPQIEQSADFYVSVPLAMEWLAHSGRDLEPMELGFLAAQQASQASMKPAHLTEVLAAPTGLKRLQAFIRIARKEDSNLHVSLRREGSQIRVICDETHLNRHPFICFAEWLNLQGTISVLSDLGGPGWSPRELTFVSRFTPPVPAGQWPQHTMRRHARLTLHSCRQKRRGILSAFFAISCNPIWVACIPILPLLPISSG